MILVLPKPSEMGAFPHLTTKAKEEKLAAKTTDRLLLYPLKTQKQLQGLLGVGSARYRA